MPNLYTISTKKENSQQGLVDGERFSVFYHDLFDYPLDFSGLIKWTPHRLLRDYAGQDVGVVNKRGYYFLEGHEGLIYKRILRKRISAKKMLIAKRAAKILAFVPGVKMVAVTGSLAMSNSSEESDIDLMIVTKKGSLWTTRLFAYSLIRLFNIRVRKPNDLRQKDKLCLNMWLDESDLTWPEKDRNLYTAHEIAQVVPLVNKDEAYKRFLSKNGWILRYWPNSVKIGNWKLEIGNSSPGLSLVEKLAYKLQYSYMKNKISREVVTPTRALFHPQDWGRVVLSRLNKNNGLF